MRVLWPLTDREAREVERLFLRIVIEHAAKRGVWDACTWLLRHPGPGVRVTA